MRGILLAGGSGSRLYPLTLAVNKHLLAVYDKPMVYYPLCTLMRAGARDVLLVSSPADLPRFRALLGDGAQWGIALSYAAQEAPEGVAHALAVGVERAPGEAVAVVLGDNLFHGRPLYERLAGMAPNPRGATVFTRRVAAPSEFGVAEIDADGRVLSLEEKPAAPRSDHAVTGLYLYGPDVRDRLREVRRSERGEFEITALNRLYLDSGDLRAHALGAGVAWRDMGTPRSLLAAGRYVAAQARRGRIVGCPAETAFRMGYIGLDEVAELAGRAPAPYARHLHALLSPAPIRAGAPCQN